MRRQKAYLTAAGFLLLLSLLFIPQLRYAIADYTFLQTDWSGGASSDTAGHPANQTGWTKYTSKDSGASTAVSGIIMLTTESQSATDTSDADFSAGTLSGVEVSGTGDGASLSQSSTFSNPFVDNVGKWMMPPYMPSMESYSCYVQAGDYIYAFWTRDYFGRYSIADKTWAFMAKSPAPVNLGCTLAYPGSGDYIYATRGENSKDFWRYSISNNEWYELADTPGLIRQYAAMAATTTDVYLLRGDDLTTFYAYNIAADTWSQKDDCLTAAVDYGYLIYPGSGEQIFYGRADDQIYIYNISDDDWSRSVDSGPRITYMWYPGSGDYIYCLEQYREEYWNYRTFFRYNFTTDTFDWDDDYRKKTPTTINHASVIYKDGNYLRLLHSKNYTQPLNFNLDTQEWDEISAQIGNYFNDGTSLVYPGSGDYVYRIGPRDNTDMCKYSISNNQWEYITDAPSAYGASRSADAVYYDGYIYASEGDGRNEFFRYNVSGDSWQQLSNAPAAFEYGSAITAANGYVYAFKGNNTTTFWRYEIATDTWSDAEDVSADAPATVYGGGALCYPGSGDYVYALRGDDTKKFWRYSISGNSWDESLPDAPIRFGYSSSYISDLVYPGSGNYIYAMGGAYSQYARYNFVDSEWEYLGRTPYSSHHYRAASVAAGDYLYGSYYTDNQLYRCNITTNEWDDRFNDTSYAGRGSMVYPGGDIAYMFYESYDSHVWKYSISQDDWVGLLKTPFLMTTSTTAHYNPADGYIYVIPGDSKELWRYNLSGETWEQLADSPLILSNGCCIAGNGTTLYITQGSDYGGTESNFDSYNFLKYNIATDDWDQLADLPTDIDINVAYGQYLEYVSSENKVYFKAPTDYYIYSYDPAADSWTQEEQVYASNREGSALYYPGSGNLIYYFRGLYEDAILYTYNVADDVWTNLGKTPFYYDADYWDVDMFIDDGMLYLWMPMKGFTKYYIADAEWALPSSNTDSRYPFVQRQGTLSRGEDADTIYTTSYRYFQKYSISNRSWTSQEGLKSPYYSGLGQLEEAPQMVYSSESNCLYLTKGEGYSSFYRYIINSNIWQDTEASDPPHPFGHGHKLVSIRDSIYALLGGNTTYFYKYDVNADSWTELNGPTSTIGGGAVMCWPGGDYIYAGRGSRSQDFLKYSISENIWYDAADIPIGIGYYRGSSLAYPGRGDYLYLATGPSGYDAAESSAFLKYSISQDAWENAECVPTEGEEYGKLIYPGSGNYLYYWPGADAYNRFILSYLVFKEGSYTSDVKSVGINEGYGLAEWTANDNGFLELKARTSNNASMSGATDFADITGLNTSGESLSGLAPYVTDTQKYFQYKLNFYADDLTALPSVDDVTISWDKYTSDNEVISSAYDTGDANNRLTGLTWSETLLAGTDVRFQISTAADAGGQPGTWGEWLGPGGTQSYTNPYSDENNYSFADTVEVASGVGRLKKIYESFTYTQRVVLDNSASSAAYSNVIVALELDSTNKHFWEHVQPDGSDVRFVDASGNALSYCFDSTDYGSTFNYSGQYAKILVVLSEIPAATKTSIYLKYGNDSVESQSSTDMINLPVTGNLLAWWEFDEDIGSTAADSSGNGNSGTLHENFDWVTGRFGNAVYFSGDASDNSSYMTTDFTLPQTSGSECTIAVWLKPNAGIEDRSSWAATQYIFDTGDGGYDWDFRIYSNKYYYVNTGNASVRTDVMADEEEWQFMVLTIEPNVMRLYKNGALADTITENFSYDSSTNPFTVSGRAGYGRASFAGVMDQFAVYDGALSASEVTQLYQQPQFVELNYYYTLAEDNSTSPSLSGWNYRERIEVDNSSWGELEDYQYKVTLSEADEGFWSKCREDGYDARFVDEDNETVLDFYRESFDYDSKTAIFWIKDPDIDSGEIKNIYLYYGRSDAADASSFDNTMTKTYDETGYNTSGAYLNDADDAITISDSDSLDITSNLTLEANVKYMADTWLPGFSYRKEITLDNTGGSAYEDTACFITVSYVADKMNSDYSDLRFTNAEGDILRYNIGSYDDSEAEVAVEVPNLPADSIKTIYMYYGNAEAASGATDEISVATDSLYNFESGMLHSDWTQDINFDITSSPARNSYSAGQSGSTINAVLEPSVLAGGERPTTFEFYWYELTNQTGFTTELIDSDGDVILMLGGNNPEWEISDGDGSTTPYSGSGYNRWIKYTVEFDWAGGQYTYHFEDTSSGVVRTGTRSLIKNTNIEKFTINNNVWGSASYMWVDDISISGVTLSFPTTFGAEEAQPAIDQTIIAKDGAYELKFTESGLTALLNSSEVASSPNYIGSGYTNLALTYDGANVKLYSDGVQIASESFADDIAAASSDINVGNGMIGGVDEVRIWNIVREAGNIKANKKVAVSGDKSGLVCYLKLNENTGTAAADATANTNNGTLINGTAWVEAPYAYVRGMPLLLYHLDDMAGLSASDSSGNSNTLTLSGASWSSTDLTGFSAGGSLEFNGVDNYATADDASSLDIEDKITIECWIRPDAITGNSVILDKGNDMQQDNIRSNYKLVQSGNDMVFSFYNGEAQPHTANNVLSAGSIHHVVATFDESEDEIKIYVNGVLEYTGTETLQMLTNDDMLHIGRAASGISEYDGLLDEVRVYNRIMNASEVLCHYQTRIYSPTEPTLYDVYEPPESEGVGVYAANNPVIQPIVGVFYSPDNKPIEFYEITNTPGRTGIKYQISANGYIWYWYDGSGWTEVEAGYAEANTAAEINSNLSAFVSENETGDFCYRAYLHGDAYAMKTPSLDSITINTLNDETYYLDPTGAEDINTLHTDAVNDQWFRYKAILYSDGENTPIVDEASIDYISAYLTLSSPTGGEELNVGSTHTITWSSQAIESDTGLVSIDYSTDGGSTYAAVAENIADDGSYDWSVPDEPTTEARIKIKSDDFPVIYDTSEDFSIVAIKVTSPNGAEIWEQSQNHAITWNTYGEIPNSILKIEYSDDNGSSWNTIVSATPDDGAHDWSVPAIESDEVLIKISSPENSSISDTSDAVFSVVPQPVISISSPAGGEEWLMGSENDITWTTNSLNFSDTVALYYSADDFETETEIATGVSIGSAGGAGNTSDYSGSYTWTLPEVDTDNMKVKVVEESIPAGRDTQELISAESNAFTILPPSVTIISPATDTEWVAGDTEEITWSGQGAVSDDLLLEYRVGEAGDWTEIVTGEANDGTYLWIIPDEAIGDEVYVRITDNQRPEVTDTSEAFIIYDLPQLNVTDPNGGEAVIMGSTYSVTWEHVGNQLDEGGDYYNKVNLYHSTDNGENWTIFAYQAPNTGSYDWSVPELQTDTALIKITVDGHEDTVYDVSDEVFSITIPVVTITAPNGGESWYATGTYNITWDSEGSVSDNLTLEYSTDNGSSWNTIVSGQANTGTYSWAVADVDTTEALMRITDMDLPEVTDSSNAVFTITPPFITINAPNGGEEYVIGTSAEITWVSGGYEQGAVSDELVIEYSTNLGVDWTLIAAGQANDGSYNWSIPDDPSTDCLIRVYDSQRPETVDISNSKFSIVEPYIEVLTPNGGESWPIGTEQTITWRTVGTISDNLTIKYSKDNFESDEHTIAAGQANDGSYTWNIPDDYSTTVKIRIIDGDRPDVYDDSDASFSISYPTITIIAPNGGELWTVGDEENITWSTVGSVSDNLTIEYSKDNFVSDFNEIATAEANDGTYLWSVPDDVSASIRVRITDATRPAVWDKSNADFTILPVPQLTVLAPASDALWRLGTDHTITWEDNGGLVSNNLKLELSTGGAWQTIADGIANTGSYNWSVPDESSYVSSACRFKITDNNRDTNYDESDEFEIAYPLITITAPNGGEYWAVGDEAPVTWTSEGAVSDNLVLSYSPDAGSNYYTIASGQANDGSYTWDVPDNPSSNALFRIQDGNRPSNVLDVSDATFDIIAIPTITITAPNGGEEYVLGDTLSITWSWKGLSVSDNLIIDYALDGDFNDPNKRQIIASSGVENDGSYEWVIPDSALTGSSLVIRITDYERTLITDQGDGYFRIRGGFNVTSPAGGEEWLAKSAHNITWDTQGNIPRVNLQYSTDDGSTWSTIASAVSNEETYSWTLPDVQSSTVKVRVVDYTDDTVVNESESFNIVYATVQFNIKDYDTLEHLSELNANEPITGWSIQDASLNSPITRAETYPYDSYTTFFTKEEYIDNSVTWSPPTSGTDTYVVNLYMESTAAAQVSWEAILTYSYSPASDTLNAVGSLQRKGKLVGTMPHEMANLGSATLNIYTPDNELMTNLSAAQPNQTTAMYNFTYTDTEFEAGKVYPATLIIVYNEREYVSSVNIDVGSEILQYEFFTETAEQISTSVAKIESAVAGGTAEIKEELATKTEAIETAVTTAKTEIKEDTAKILTGVEETIPAKQAETQEQVETFMKSEILNTESQIRSGDEMTIRYRTHSGLAPAVDIYDPDNSQLISKGLMKEIGTTGIYEYPVEFEGNWGRGDFTIVCSETTKGTLDALSMNVISSDIESIAGDLGAVLGATANLPDLEDITTSLQAQLAVVESSLSSMTEGATQQLEAELTELENVFEHLSAISEQVKSISSQHNVNLDKLYEVSKEKSDDVNYLVNKAQELKAAVELNQKLLEDVSNEPVTQTWYEYK